MVLGKLSVPGRPTDLDNSRTRAHIYSKVSYKNACRSIDSDLTSHSTILNSISRRFFVV